MAMNTDAILRIKAQATGGEQLQALSGKIQGVEGAAKRLTATSGVLTGALSTLAPIASIAGITALVKKQIEAGDNMNDLAQKTGVPVEMLAKFGKAASVSGTDLESVAKATAKFSRALYEGKADKALEDLGISAKDASGNLKSADQAMLEVADKFKTMDDGPRKVAIAMQLFGKSGAEMIPMLNEGGKAIEAMGTKMTTGFAKQADEYSDKLTLLTGKVGGLVRGLTVSLLPALIKITDAVTEGVTAFNALPEPIKTVVGSVVLLTAAFTALKAVGIVSMVASIGSALYGIGATLLGFIGSSGVIPAIATALGGLVSWIGGTFIPGLLAFFSGPVGWTVLAVAAVVALGIAFRKPLEDFAKWLWDWGEPIRKFWTDLGTGILDGITNTFKAVYKFFDEKFFKPFAQAWKNLKEDPKKFVIDALDFIKGLIKGIEDIAVAIFDAMVAPFNNASQSIVAGFNQVVRFMGGKINEWIEGINGLIRYINDLPPIQGLKIAVPEIPLIPLPQLARGGWTDRATAVVIGEGGDPGGEYAIPAARMPAALDAWERGMRGAELVRAMHAPGLAPGRAVTAASSTPAGPVNVTIRTGPVIRQPDGSQWVRIDEVPAIVQAAVAASRRAR